MAIRLAITTELPAVLRLLAAASLPTEDVADHARNLFIALEGGEVVGAIEIEDHGSVALMRSLVVSEAHRGRGLAQSLCATALARATTLGLSDVYVLTESAEAWFAARGFARLARDQAPRAVQHTRQFRELCPASAVLMRLELV